MITELHDLQWHYDASEGAPWCSQSSKVWTDYLVLENGKEIACLATEPQARLMAAAPDLYRACSKFIELWDDYEITVNDLMDDIESVVVPMVRDALKKIDESPSGKESEAGS